MGKILYFSSVLLVKSRIKGSLVKGTDNTLLLELCLPGGGLTSLDGGK